jgi:hypothetical protein
MKKEKKVVNTKDAIQRFILEGREVILKKENETSFVRIRFNNEDTDGTQKWRVLINGNELRTSEVIINCQVRTLTEEFQEIGIKHHIVCDAKEIIFKNNIATVN